MIVREAIQEIGGFRYVTEHLEICSSLGRRLLYEMEWLNGAEELAAEWERIAEVAALLESEEGLRVAEKIALELMQVRDVRGTVKHTGELGVLDDLELFELKNFALLSEELRGMTAGWKCVRIPDLGGVVALLDPEGKRVPHFYIYDAYSAELAALRAEMKSQKQAGADEQEVERLYVQSVELEDGVREQLSAELRGSHPVLQEALLQVGCLDILLAKAKQVREMGLVKPSVGRDASVLRGLFHPQLCETLSVEGKQFQPVDLVLPPCATLVTGANMAGKTVLLKSVALAQCMFQFGFYVPAGYAEMVPVEKILMSIGDEQDELSGLSSFAAEMLRINEIVGRVKTGKRALVLVDELARTTNPEEGRMIVNGVVGFLTDRGVQALVTTHYSGISAPCRKLRVKGFVEGKVQGHISLKNINEFIDYSLEEEHGDEVPQEALRIAALLGVDGELLERMEKEKE